MLVDHIGIVMFPDDELLRIIGRFAMPIYAYCLVQGFRHTRSRAKYVQRLAVIAAVSQIPYLVALGNPSVNIVGTFAVCLLVLMAIDRIKSRAAAVAVVVASVGLLELVPFEYGAYALLLVLAYRFLSSHALVVAHAALNATFLLYNGSLLQAFSVAPTMILVYAPAFFSFVERIKLRRWLWRSFYPAHLAALAVVKIIWL